MCYMFFFFLMIRRPPRSTRTDTLFPYTTLFQSLEGLATPTRLHGVDDPVELFTFQQTLNIEHGAEVNRLLTAHAGGGAVGLDIAAAHEGERPIIDSIAIFKMQRRERKNDGAGKGVSVRVT